MFGVGILRLRAIGLAVAGFGLLMGCKEDPPVQVSITINLPFDRIEAVASAPALISEQINWSIQTNGVRVTSKYTISLSSSTGGDLLSTGDNASTTSLSGTLYSNFTKHFTLEEQCVDGSGEIIGFIRFVVAVDEANHVGSASKTLPYTFLCTQEALAVEPIPLYHGSRFFDPSINSYATEPIPVNWRFTTTGPSEHLLAYQLDISEGKVQLPEATGTALPNVAMQTVLNLVCKTYSRTRVEEQTLTIRIGNNASESLTVSYTCTSENVQVRRTDRPFAAVNSTATGVLEWYFEQEPGDLDVAMNYEITSDKPSLTIDKPTGRLAPDTIMTTEFSMVCSEPGVYVDQVRITLGKRTHEVAWRTTCTNGDAGDFEHVAGKLYQGPLVADLRFHPVNEVWRIEYLPTVHADDKPVRFAWNRDVFVEVALEGDLDSLVEIALDFTERDETVRFELRELKTIPPQVPGEPHRLQKTYRVGADNLLDLGYMRITLDPTNEERANAIEVDLREALPVEMPDFNVVFVPITMSGVTPAVTDETTATNMNAATDRLPIENYSVRIRDPVVGAPSLNLYDQFYKVFDVWRAEGEPGEYWHGIVPSCPSPDGWWDFVGAASRGSVVGVTVELWALAFAHEIGHNFNLRHSFSDRQYPYPDSTIGDEYAWFMTSNLSVTETWGKDAVIYAFMGSGAPVVTSQYSYGKGQDFVLNKVWKVAAEPPLVARTRGFELLKGRSLAITGSVSPDGEWAMRYNSMVENKPFPSDQTRSAYDLHVIHTPSGALLHAENLPVFELAHYDGVRSWSAHVPAYATINLAVQIVQNNGRVVFEAALDQ